MSVEIAGTRDSSVSPFSQGAISRQLAEPGAGVRDVTFTARSLAEVGA
jgi:hypothetical protein